LYEDIYFFLSDNNNFRISHTYTSNDNMNFNVHFGNYVEPGEYCIGFGINDHEWIKSCNQKISVLNVPKLIDTAVLDNSNTRVIRFIFDSTLNNMQSKCLFEEIIIENSRLKDIDIVNL
jgi:spore cortex formation protein SpoVR/YcgB (stage V sporulation)